MPLVNNPEIIKNQYASGEKLDIRIALHQKYSLNQEPFGDWIMAHYRLKPGQRVLELGCGTGHMWREPDRWLPEAASLTLTDFSEGMLAETRRNVPRRDNIELRTMDIQHIEYERDSFDVVIANMMLYHVPDLQLALSEVSRVLKPEGRFFCATVGENGVARWLAETLGHVDGNQYPFSLQNGREKLLKHFGRVDVHLREDGLQVTDVEDLTDYVLSMASFSGLRDWPREKLTGLLRAQQRDGVISIPKEYGLFEAVLPLG